MRVMCELLTCTSRPQLTAQRMHAVFFHSPVSMSVLIAPPPWCIALWITYVILCASAGSTGLRITDVRYPKEYKEQARQRLVEGGARLTKKRGFAAAGVDDLAAAAGVTSGAVYKHFGGKSELLAAIIEVELARSAARFAAVPAGDLTKLDEALAAYLSPKHVDHPELGCALPSLGADVARAGADVRQAFEDGLLAVHAALKRHLRSDDSA